jgi:hypothetical protein
VSNIIKAIKSGRLKWAGHVLLKREMRNACKISVGNLKRIHHLGKLCVDSNCMLLVELEIYISTRRNQEVIFMNIELPPEVYLGGSASSILRLLSGLK